MSPTSRRIFFYWLLLLVPTLVVGGGALQLLRREQGRLAEQGAYAAASRQAAVASRARLVVENAELLVGDVQTGLLDALAAEPAPALEAFLNQWERDNPLVRIAFVAADNGVLRRPAATATDEEARGFVRRFSARLRQQRPWSEPPSEKDTGGVAGVQKRAAEESVSRSEIAANVAQVQSARRDVQELVKPRKPASAPAVASSLRNREQAEGKMEAEVGADRRGWLAAVVDGRLHLLGWVQPAGGREVRGVELDVAELASRLGNALPAQPGTGEGYALRDDRGRVVHQAGLVDREGEPVVRVPLAKTLLPGWEVAAYLAPEAGSRAGGAAFFWVGALLVAIFVTAILAGGSLLLWQARRSEAEAAQKTSFVANVSHEFKTPLTTIRLYSELLAQGRVRDAAQAGEYLGTIGRETQRLARLVNNALDFSRLEQGKKKYAREEIDLGAALTRVLDSQAPRLQDAGVTLERRLPSAPLPITTDRDAVEQIVLNLLDNTCKYAAAAGVATVALSSRGARGAEIRVADRGPGVPAGQRERIFEKFHRVDETLTAERGGAGLGLSIARQLARGLGGELRYAPREGGGAEFILELP